MKAEAQWRELRAKNGIFGGLAASPKYMLYFMAVALMFLQEVIPGAWRYIDAALLTFVDVLRLGSGLIPASNLSACKRPSKLLMLYEYEPSPWCRRVRETLSVLRLDYASLPCPHETLKKLGYCKDARFRNELKSQGKRLQFPYLEDPNTGVQLYESGRIIDYLWKEYGAEARAPLNYRIATFLPFEIITHLLACCCRPLMSCGFMRTPSKRPDNLLELFACEASPRARRVREVLSCLELPYIVHVGGTPHSEKPTGESKHNDSFTNAFAPVIHALGMRLVDPNTKTELETTTEIVKYLRDTYELEPAPSASWLELNTGSQETTETKTA